MEAAGPALRERAFRAARRHSLFVKALRLALPVTAIGLLAYYGLTLGVSWQLGAGRLKVEEYKLTADDLTMKNPKYFGLTKDGGSYEVRAKKAVLEFSKDAPVKLVDIEGDLLQPTNVATRLKAKHGLLDNAKSELELYDGIEIDATNGLTARLSRAMVFSKEHRIVSKEPVDLTMPAGRVRGSAMTLRTDTREATFLGEVKTRLVPAAQQGSARTPAPAFGANSRGPVDVVSEQLYVNDTAKTALFMGKVVAVQGDATLKAQELHVNYEGAPASDLVTGAAAQKPAEASRLSRLVAKDGTVITIGADRRVASDQAEFDVTADTALFTGNVLVNQQRNVLQGRRLFIDRKSGNSRLEAPAEGDQAAGRIAATFYQGDGKTGGQPKQKRSAAEAPGAPDGVFGTFKTDPNAPMDIEADTLDVRDGEKRAVFNGNVKAQQGDVVIRTVELIAFYSGQAGLGLTGGDESGDKASSQLTRVEAKQRVLITSKDGQSASGDWAIFDTKANTVLLGDNVTVSRGKDVVQGSRLKIDLTSGMYRFELDHEASAAQPAAPAAIASPPLAAPTATDPSGRACPPGKQCLLFYPKDAQEKAKDVAKKLLPGNAPPAKANDGWQPSTSASPAMRGQ